MVKTPPKRESKFGPSNKIRIKKLITSKSRTRHARNQSMDPGEAMGVHIPQEEIQNIVPIRPSENQASI